MGCGVNGDTIGLMSLTIRSQAIAIYWGHGFQSHCSITLNLLSFLVLSCLMHLMLPISELAHKMGS